MKRMCEVNTENAEKRFKSNNCDSSIKIIDLCLNEAEVFLQSQAPHNVNLARQINEQLVELSSSDYQMQEDEIYSYIEILTQATTKFLEFSESITDSETYYKLGSAYFEIAKLNVPIINACINLNKNTNNPQIELVLYQAKGNLISLNAKAIDTFLMMKNQVGREAVIVCYVYLAKHYKALGDNLYQQQLYQAAIKEYAKAAVKYYAVGISLLSLTNGCEYQSQAHAAFIEAGILYSKVGNFYLEYAADWPKAYINLLKVHEVYLMLFQGLPSNIEYEKLVHEFHSLTERLSSLQTSLNVDLKKHKALQMLLLGRHYNFYLDLQKKGAANDVYECIVTLYKELDFQLVDDHESWEIFSTYFISSILRLQILLERALFHQDYANQLCFDGLKQELKDMHPQLSNDCMGGYFKQCQIKLKQLEYEVKIGKAENAANLQIQLDKYIKHCRFDDPYRKSIVLSISKGFFMTNQQKLAKPSTDMIPAFSDVRVFRCQ